MSLRSASVVALVLLSYVIAITHATTIDVVNNCAYPVWAAADPGAGKQLNQGDTWQVMPPDGTKMARVWGRTGCNSDASKCDIGGDCGKLDCDDGKWGENPKTVFEYTLAQPDNPTDTLDISLIEGFNIPMTLTPTTNVGTLENKCREINCNVDINGQCPTKLKATHGCYNPCTKMELGSCGANSDDSKFFKSKCQDAYSFPKDDQTSTWSCPRGTNYKLSFC